MRGDGLCSAGLCITIPISRLLPASPLSRDDRQPLTQLLAREHPLLAQALGSHDRVLWIDAGSAPAEVDAGGKAEYLRLHSGDHLVLDGALRAPIDAWPFRDRCFDHLVLHHVLDFTPVVAIVVAEALRVLKPERELWITGIGPWSWQRWRLAMGMPKGFSPHPPRLSQLKALLASHGCVDISATALVAGGKAKSAGEFCGSYLLCARKREIRPVQNGRRVRVLAPKASAWSPTTREAA